MSEIFGEGHGSAHDWARGYTSPQKCTYYTCRRCGHPFSHWYDVTPNIYQAMQQSGVPAKCAPKGA